MLSCSHRTAPFCIIYWMIFFLLGIAYYFDCVFFHILFYFILSFSITFFYLVPFSTWFEMAHLPLPMPAIVFGLVLFFFWFSLLQYGGSGAFCIARETNHWSTNRSTAMRGQKWVGISVLSIQSRSIAFNRVQMRYAIHWPNLLVLF